MISPDAVSTVATPFRLRQCPRPYRSLSIASWRIPRPSAIVVAWEIGVSSRNCINLTESRLWCTRGPARVRRVQKHNRAAAKPVHLHPPPSVPVLSLIDALHHARAAEKEQALFYRALAAQAEDRGDAVLSERCNELHADEQHHVSRLTARLLELGAPLADIAGMGAPPAALDGWEAAARLREDAEVARYEVLLGEETDGDTRALLEQILDTERHHAAELGGKWTTA